MSKPLPVTDLLNNIRIINNFLFSTEQIVLTPSIINNYGTLANNFRSWQQGIYGEYFYGLVSYNLTTTPQQLQIYYGLGFDAATMQSLAQSTFFAPNNPTPKLISVADNVSNLVAGGSTFISQLEQIAAGIQGADEKQVAQLMEQVKQLNDEFDKQEEEIVNGMLGLGEDLVVTAINIGIAVGTEGGDIKPVIKSISKIGKGVINEVKVTTSASKTIDELQQAWAQLDAATSALAQITLIVNQLKAVTAQTTDVLAALTNVINDWQDVADTTKISAADWASYGNTAMQEWASRMVTISFATATQNIS